MVFGLALTALALAALLVPFAPASLALTALGGILLAGAAVGLLTVFEAGGAARGLRLAWVVAATLTGAAVLWHHSSGLGSIPLFVSVGAALMLAITLAEGWRQHRLGRVRWGGLAAGGLLLTGLGLLIVRAAPHAGLMTLGVFLAISLGGFGLSLIARMLIDRLGAWFL
ncbi:hypothetical protein GALL_546540 [mine drainage metagenome]|uniref:Uncharacterized protein n=1 Tax=mine drainage metagenome TaxID=410659 RepID=A0A1J5PJU5_9ZZZZ